MVKKIAIYILLMVALDLLINFIINKIQDNPGTVIFVSSIVRLITLLVLFPLCALLMFTLLKKNNGAALIATIGLVYLLIPLVVYFLKETDKTIFGTYVELHADFYLFSVVLMPYILANAVSYFLLNRMYIHT